MDKYTLQRILIDTAAMTGKEIGGLIFKTVDGFDYCILPNISQDPLSNFEFNPEDYLLFASKRNIHAVWHSHPKGYPTLSIQDRASQLASDCDWWLIHEEECIEFPCPQALLGRVFEHGKTDCYTLFKDFYYLAGADLPDFEREEDWWWKGQDLYLSHMEANGFRQLIEDECPQVGDIVLINIQADVPNHAGVLIGNNLIIHHGPNRLSKRDLYDGYWRDHTHSLWRYTKCNELDFTVPLLSLELPSN